MTMNGARVPARDPFRGIDRSVYPDLVTQDGLVTAIRTIALLEDIDAGRVDVQYPAEFAGYTSAAMDSARGRILVDIATSVRLFMTAVSDTQIEVATGATDDLPEVVRMAAAWNAGASYDELVERFVFLRISDLAKVLASPDPIGAQWAYLLDSSYFEDDRELLEASHQQPDLRARFPDMSHRELRLSKEFRGTDGVIRIASTRDGTYIVSSDDAGSTTRFASLPEAVSAAAEALRSHLHRHATDDRPPLP